MKHYYLVGENKHINAIDAWQDFNQSYRITSTKLELVLFGGLFDTYNWLSIPDQSISALEEERARQILTKHGNNIRLLYSGGSDSYSVAHAFARIGQPIPEYTMFEYRAMKQGKVDSPEFTKLKINELKLLHLLYNLDPPNVRILRIDQDIFKIIYKDKNWFEGKFGYAGTQGFSASTLVDIPHMFKEDNKVSILGMEKPRVKVDDVGYYMEMNDKNTLYGVSSKYDYEWFYLSPDLSDLANAQCRATINLSKETNISVDDIQTKEEYYDLWCKVLGRRTDTKYNILSFQCKNMGFSKPDAGNAYGNLYTHVNEYANDNRLEWNNYMYYLNALREVTGMDSPHGIITKKYYLEKHNKE